MSSKQSRRSEAGSGRGPSCPAGNSRSSDQMEAKLARAVEFHHQGAFDRAELEYLEVLRLEPDNADALHLLGVLAHQRGDHDRAAWFITQAVTQCPSNATYLLNLGSVVQAKGELGLAADCYGHALRLDPHLALAHNNLGNIHQARSEWSDAITCYQAALNLVPGSALTLNNLGTTFQAQGELSRAIECYRRAVALDPGLFQACLNLGLALHAAGQLDEALQVFEKVLEQRPGDVMAQLSRGIVLHEQGEFQAAEDCYTRVLELEPGHVKALYNLTQLRKVSRSDFALRDRLDDVTRRPGVSPQELSYAHFAMGKLHDDWGEYDQAFQHYRRANELARPEFNRAAHLARIDALVESFPRAFFQERRGWGDDSELPVFVLGMPRSGTSLVEQILSSHPAVWGGGERDDVARLAAELSRGPGGFAPPVPELRQLGRETAAVLGRRYLTKLQDLAPAAQRVTDKMPENFLHLGLIALLLPGARVIHCRRDPLDVCLSCYFQHFHARLPYTYDLGDLGFYHHQYDRLMAHWKEVLPLRLMELQYEELIRNQAGLTRELLSFCGLEWDARCLSFERKRRAVRTASSWQVRQPLYTSSVCRWRHYNRHLDPLKLALRGEVV